MLVGKRMSSPAITVTPGTSMQEALDLMNAKNIRRLPVVDKNGNLIGIVSERELLKASPSDATTLSRWEINTMLLQITVDKLMTKDVLTVTEETPLEEAAKIMADQNISGLPVVRGSKVVGIIAETDIFNIFLEILGAREEGILLSTHVPKKPGTLFNITKSIYESGGDIVSLGTFQTKSSEYGEVTVKVRGLDLATLKEAVEPYVLEILDARETQQS